MFLIQSQSKHNGDWQDNGPAPFQHGPFDTAHDAILWAKTYMNPIVDGRKLHRWVVVNSDTGERICTV